jgi:hypothetical protein
MLTKEQWKAWYDYRVQFTKDTTGREEEESYLKIFADLFDITTYDDDMDEYFGQKILTVLLSIVNKTHCDYHVGRQDYIDYLMVCQFKGVYPLLEWGTSIRTAWINPPDKGWDLNDVLGDYCGAPAGPVLRTRAEIESFILITAELIVEQVHCDRSIVDCTHGAHHRHAAAISSRSLLRRPACSAPHPLGSSYCRSKQSPGCNAGQYTC